VSQNIVMSGVTNLKVYPSALNECWTFVWWTNWENSKTTALV